MKEGRDIIRDRFATTLTSADRDVWGRRESISAFGLFNQVHSSSVAL